MNKEISIDELKKIDLNVICELDTEPTTSLIGFLPSNDDGMSELLT